jgi:hypothetical protein|tara:strand:+ start:16083 stop:16760 length:678 start_codon:yes stop_codon:yes gene_type:complete
MNITKLTLAVTTLFLGSLAANAQDQSGRNSVVKFSPSKMMRGEIQFSYERKMAEQASFEFSAGPAISNVSPLNFDHIFGNGSNATESSLLGFVATIGARYYPLEDRDALEGFYVSPIIGFTQLNYNFSADNIGYGIVLPDQRGHSNQTSFAFVFGTQKWLSSTFCLDMYIGSGIKQITEQNYFIDYGDFNGPINPTPKWGEQTNTNVTWFITGGIKVGIGFGKKG